MSGTTSTPNYGLLKPVPGADNDQWGTHLNGDLDILDTQLKATDTKASAAYPASNPNGYQTAAQVTTALGPYALIASPTFTGDPKAPTPTTGDNDTSIATTSFVQTAVAGVQRRVLYQNTVSTPNVGASTAEELIYVWPIPAGTLTQVGDMLHIVAKFDYIGSTDSKAFRFKLGTNSNGLTGAVNVCTSNANAVGTTQSSIEAWITKSGTNAQKTAYVNVQATNSVLANESTTAINDTGTMYFSVTFQNSTNAVAACGTVFSVFMELLPLVSQTGTGGGSGGIPEAPTDGQTYGRIGSSASWSALTAPPAGSSTTPIMDGTATIGVGTTYARADHIHPTDTSRAPLASPVFTGDARAVTPTAGDNDTSIATTAFVQTAVASAPALNNGGRNLLHNPLFNISQRGVGPWTTSGVYTADRWTMALASDTASITQSSLADAGRAAIGDEAATYALTNVFTGNAAAGAFNMLTQWTEGVRRLSGKTVTVSFWAAAASGTPKLGVSLDQWFGTPGGGGSTQVSGAGQSVTLGTTWARYSLTFALASTAGKTLSSSASDATGLNIWYSSGATNATRAGAIGVQSGTISLWGVQLEIGSVATPLEKPDPQQDLAKCQRFYQLGRLQLNAYAGAGAVSFVTSFMFPVQMRAAPTVAVNGTFTYVNANSGAFSAAADWVYLSYNSVASGAVACVGPYTASADL